MIEGRSLRAFFVLTMFDLLKDVKNIDATSLP